MTTESTCIRIIWMPDIWGVEYMGFVTWSPPIYGARTHRLFRVIRLNFLWGPNSTAGMRNVNRATSGNSLFIAFDSL